MSKIVSEFELERSPVQLLRDSAEDAEHQLRRARRRSERAQRRVENLETCVGEWAHLLSDYESSFEHMQEQDAAAAACRGAVRRMDRV